MKWFCGIIGAAVVGGMMCLSGVASGQTTSTFVDPGPTVFQALWTDADNWDTAAHPDNGQPAAGDTYNAIVDDGNVGLDSDITIEALTLNGSGVIQQVFDLSGATPPRQTLTLNAPFAFMGGRVSGNVAVSANAGVHFTTAADKRINTSSFAGSDALQPILNIGGSSAWTDGEIMGTTVGGIAPLVNLLAGAELTATAADRTFGPRLENAGTIHIDPGAGAMQTYPQMFNAGTVNVLSGTAKFASSFSGIQTSTGDFVVDSGAAIFFENHDLAAGSSVTGDGDVAFGLNSGTAITSVNGVYHINGTTTVTDDVTTFANPATTGGLILDSAFTFLALNGPSLTASDLTTFRDGTVIGNIELNADGGMAFESSSPHRFSSDISVNLGGQTTLNPGQSVIRVSQNAQLNVRNGGTLTAEGPQAIEFQDEPGSFSNAGTIIKTGGGTLSLSIPSINTGLVIVEAGNNINFRSSSSAGLTQTGGELRLDGGGLGGIQSITGGSVTGFGKIFSGFDLGPGSTLSPGHGAQTGPSVGTLDIISLDMEDGSTTRIELAGTAESDFDRLLGEFTLGGDLILELIDGFGQDVTASDTFTIIDAEEPIDGQFANVANGQRLDTADGVGSFLVHYGADSAFDDKLVVLSDFLRAAIPGDFDGDGDVDAFDLGIWQTGFGITGGATAMDGDADADGDVDAFDLGLWQTNFGTGVGGATVPEPGAAVLIGTSFAVLAGQRTTRRRDRRHA